jgi:hypothetical protein
MAPRLAAGVRWTSVGDATAAAQRALHVVIDM